MTKSIRVCRIEEVKEGEPFAVLLEGFPALAVYNVEGSYFVTDNTCTHGNAMLSDGYQEGGTIECPFHGGAFDIATGEPTAFPCQIALTTYRTSVEDGWIIIERPLNAEPT